MIAENPQISSHAIEFFFRKVPDMCVGVISPGTFMKIVPGTWVCGLDQKERYSVWKQSNYGSYINKRQFETLCTTTQCVRSSIVEITDIFFRPML